MSYDLKMKIYTNENLPKGKFSIPDPVPGTKFFPTIYFNPEDYIEFIEQLTSYIKSKEDKNGKTEETIDTTQSTRCTCKCHSTGKTSS